jgi:hypothetical protein
MKHELIQRARRYATEMHERINQRRKYTLAPYDVHLKAVADLVATVTADPEMIAAAWLHDTVEDTPATFEDLEREFGKQIMLLVMDLTDISRPGDGNRAARKEIDRRHLAGASPQAKTIKLADLIDNTRDIAKHDPRFSRVYLPEMFGLLEVLSEGDPKLYLKAQKTVADCARQLGITPPQPAEGMAGGEEPDRLGSSFSQFSGLRLFTESFTARNLLEPLRSFDLGVPPERIQAAFADPGVAVIGIRQQGHLTGYLLDDDLQTGNRPLQPRSIAARQRVQLDTPLADIIHSLTQHIHCFVDLEGEVIGVVSRADIEKPVARMWLFGLIMLIDLSTTTSIREHWKDTDWRQFLTASRLAKAEELLRERQRRRMPGSLLECLQFSDKLQVLCHIENFLDHSGFASLSAAKKVFKDLEALRNNLAHGQEISSADWPAIVRLARLLGAIADSSASRAVSF